MKRTQVITNEIALQGFVASLRRDFQETGYLRATVSTDKPRTLPQNSLVYQLYSLIGANYGMSVAEARRECKLRHGVPILRAEDEEFRDAYDAVIKPLTYEQKLKAMDFWPVTSRMNTTQLGQYADSIQREYGKVAA